VSWALETALDSDVCVPVSVRLAVALTVSTVHIKAAVRGARAGAVAVHGESSLQVPVCEQLQICWRMQVQQQHGSAVLCIGIRVAHDRPEDVHGPHGHRPRSSATANHADQGEHQNVQHVKHCQNTIL
jgi:hypothetical protein